MDTDIDNPQLTVQLSHEVLADDVQGPAVGIHPGGRGKRSEVQDHPQLHRVWGQPELHKTLSWGGGRGSRGPELTEIQLITILIKLNVIPISRWFAALTGMNSVWEGHGDLDPNCAKAYKLLQHGDSTELGSTEWAQNTKLQCLFPDGESRL